LDKLIQIEAFVGAVDAGSLAKAAQEAQVTPVMIGHRIDSLEKRLGVRLLHRSTRDGRSGCESRRSGTIIAPARIALLLYVKMKLRSSRFSALVAVAACALSGCASVPQSGVNVAATEVKIYGPGKLSESQYEVVSRIWVDSWRSNFLLPTYPSEAEGIASLQTEAARVGADGLINVVCTEQGRLKWSTSSGPAILCYANAIRVRRNEG
jgi:hypothetical protein